MKVLAFVDLHGWYDILSEIKGKVITEKVDLVLCAGDFTTFGRDLEKILKKINEFPVPVILTPGNHEDFIDLEEKCVELDNITYLHGASYIFENTFIFAYGGGGFALQDPVLKKMGKRVIKDFKKSKMKNFIVMFHGPPFGSKVDLVWEDHAGNMDYADFIKKGKPDLVFCGHLHENAEVEDEIGNSKVINPGPYGMIYEL